MTSKQKMIRVLLNTDDALKLKEEADRLGLSVSAFIRLLIKQWGNGIKFERQKESIVKEG